MQVAGGDTATVEVMRLQISDGFPTKVYPEAENALPTEAKLLGGESPQAPVRNLVAVE